MKVLIAEDDPVSSLVLAKTLTKWGHEVVATTNGIEALRALEGEDAPGLAILDWMMPSMEGPEICRRIRGQATTSPAYLILLTALNRKEDLVHGLEAGADDYLTKPFDRNELRVRLQAGIRIVELQNKLTQRVHELETAIVERQKAEEALRQISLTDELTGLYNYRGFITLADHHLKANRRTGGTSVLIYADMDGLKQINDQLGHGVGSEAIVNLAEVLRQTFRDSDIIGRLGGDEFAILASETSAGALDTMLSRLAQNLRDYNDQKNHSYDLSMSIGTVRIEQESKSTIEELIARADEGMYQEKRMKKSESRAELSPGYSSLSPAQNPAPIG